MKAGGLFISLFIIIVSIAGVADAQVKPAVWLKAENAVEGSLYWLDDGLSKSRIHTSSEYASGVPANFNPTVSFGSRTDSVVIDYNVRDIEALTAFVVFRNDTLKGEKSIWGTTSLNDRKIWVSNRNLYDDVNRFEYSFGAMPYPVVASVGKLWERSVTTDAASLFLGGRVGVFDGSFQGDIAEFMVFDRQLDESGYWGVLTYLGLKYGVGILECDYVDPRGNVIWSRNDNSDFPTGIFGLGRYDTYGLYQKQSQDAYGPLAMCVGDFYATNAENRAGLPVDSYILASNNGNEPAPGVSRPHGYNGSVLLNSCRWKITSVNTSLSRSAVILRVNRQELFADSQAAICMVVDGDGDGDYSSFKVISPSYADAQGNLYFKNIDWGSSSATKALFTFAQLSAMDVQLEYRKALCDNMPYNISGVIGGGVAPYIMKIYDRDGITVVNEVFLTNRFSVDIVKQGRYMVEITDSGNNMVRYGTGENVEGYEVPRLLAIDYVITDHPLEIVPQGAAGIALYSWFFGEDMISDSGSITADKEGEYSLVYTTIDGCVLSESFYVFDNRVHNDGVPTGSEDVHTGGSSITLYPNPVTGQEYNVVIGNVNPSDVVVRVFGLDGRPRATYKYDMVKDVTHSGEIGQAGIYLLIVEIDGRVAYKSKLVKL